jgi:glycerol uptake facilitator-like aquaporin
MFTTQLAAELSCQMKNQILPYHVVGFLGSFGASILCFLSFLSNINYHEKKRVKKACGFKTWNGTSCNECPILTLS